MLVYHSVLYNLFFVVQILAVDDLQAEAITVYRNPDFFKHLSNEFNSNLYNFEKRNPYYQGIKDEYHSPTPNDIIKFTPTDSDPLTSVKNSYHHKKDDYEDAEEPLNPKQYHRGEDDDGYVTDDSPKLHSYDNYEKSSQANDNTDDYDSDDYKYPGEAKKPNAPGRPDINVHYDDGLDFSPPPRKIPNPNSSPRKKDRGPYGHPRYEEDEEQDNNWKPEIQQLQVYHQGQKYPLQEDSDENYDDHQLSHSHTFEPEKHNSYDRSERKKPIRKEELPLDSYDYNQREQPTTKKKLSQDVEIIPYDKKGTREYQKQRASSNDNRKLPQASKPKPKAIRKYIKYQIKPIVPHYKVVPLHYVPNIVFINRPVSNNLHKKRNVRPKLVEDDSAYILNSNYDMDYQKLLGKSIA